MIIAGFQKLSLVDFPGVISSVIFVQGCNFRCPYCQNPDLVTREKKFDCSEKEIFTYLDGRRKFVDGVVITGGEPCIHKDLPDLVKRIKEKSLKVKLDTNGTGPLLLERLITEKLLDHVSLDLKTSLKRYALVSDKSDSAEKVRESIKVLKASNVPHEYRTTCVPGIVDEADIKEMGQEVKGEKEYVLQQFRNIITLDPEYKHVRPYPKETLIEFKEMLEKYVGHVGIRGI